MVVPLSSRKEQCQVHVLSGMLRNPLVKGRLWEGRVCLSKDRTRHACIAVFHLASPAKHIALHICKVRPAVDWWCVLALQLEHWDHWEIVTVQECLGRVSSEAVIE